MTPVYEFLPELFLRAPYYSFAGYDLERVPEVLATGTFRNAIFLASPEFYRVLETKGFDYGRLGQKERHTLYKYYNRMCFRPTPFGSFASFTLLEWGEGDTVRLSGDEGSLLHLLPDIGQQLNTPVSVTLADGEAILIKNPTLYRFGTEFRYVRSRTDEKGHYRFSLDALPYEKFYPAFFGVFKQKQVTVSSLTKWMTAYAACAETEAAELLAYLLTEQVIYHKGTGYVISEASDDQGKPADPDLAAFWSRYKDLPLQRTGVLSGISAELEDLAGVGMPKGQRSCFYAALERKVISGGPGQEDRDELGSAVKLLSLLSTSEPGESLAKFIAEFTERFEREKVPLLTALDPDAGIPYSDLGIASTAEGIEDLHFPDQPAKDAPAAWTPVHRWLFALWSKALQKGRLAPVIIHDTDVKALAGIDQDGHLPSTLAVMFRKTGDHLLVEYAGGAAATALAGRFSAFSEEVSCLCRKLACLENEAHPDIVFADIGALSDTHTDNINRRERIYYHEIPVNTFSELPALAQIPPDDLFISVQNGELILESAKLQKRVVPRLATAFNYRHNELALFRLLCDLQFQGSRASFNFSMQSYFPGLDLYPRVVYGNTVLSLASWRIKEQQILKLRDGSEGELLNRLRRFREKRGIPQRISTGTFDQQLVFDLGNRKDAAFFFQYLSGKAEVMLVEYLLPGREVKTGNKPLSGQFICFLTHAREIYKSIPARQEPAKTKRKRNFLLGSDWLYLKLYCTPESSNGLLSEVIVPVIRKNRKIIRSWFFIRYFDKGYHLRLRIRVITGGTGAILSELNQRIETSGKALLVRNYQGDVYRRELERYGAAEIDQVEAFFCAGSELVSQFVRWKEKQAAEQRGPREFDLAIYTLYHLIEGFFGDMSTALIFTREVADGFLKEFGDDKKLKLGLDRKYRSARQDIHVLLESEMFDEQLSASFKNMVGKLSLIADKVKSRSMAERSALLANLLHMQLNRTFTVKQRQQELMAYYFLQKYLASTISRMKNSGSLGQVPLADEDLAV